MRHTEVQQERAEGQREIGERMRTKEGSGGTLGQRDFGGSPDISHTDKSCCNPQKPNRRHRHRQRLWHATLQRLQLESPPRSSPDCPESESGVISRQLKIKFIRFYAAVQTAVVVAVAVAVALVAACNSLVALGRRCLTRWLQITSARFVEVARERETERKRGNKTEPVSCGMGKR